MGILVGYFLTVLVMGAITTVFKRALISLGETTTQGRVFCSSEPLVGSSFTNTMANLSTIGFLDQTRFPPPTNPVIQLQGDHHQITQPTPLSPSF